MNQQQNYNPTLDSFVSVVFFYFFLSVGSDSNSQAVLSFNALPALSKGFFHECDKVIEACARSTRILFKSKAAPCSFLFETVSDEPWLLCLQYYLSFSSPSLFICMCVYFVYPYGFLL